MPGIKSVDLFPEHDALGYCILIHLVVYVPAENCRMTGDGRNEFVQNFLRCRDARKLLQPLRRLSDLIQIEEDPETRLPDAVKPPEDPLRFSERQS